VGKSSVINTLVASSKHAHGTVRVAVASQPGKTKHFQTLFLPDDSPMQKDMMLCDCPGLVFPSFVSNTADLLAAGVYPISQMRDIWPVIRLICLRIPREIINAQYGIRLPIPTAQEMRENGWKELPPPTGEEFLGTFCIARGMLAANSGIPDYTRAARVVIKDYAAGRLLYCHAPPSVQPDQLAAFNRETIVTSLHNTRKFREKILLRQQQKSETSGASTQQDPAGGEESLDHDLLALLGDPTLAHIEPKDRSSGIGKKWAKKNRKNRNKDPYGCQSTPDESLVESRPVGVTVGGKYGPKGYTRPNTYAVRTPVPQK
jgi:large subunit GTPase 1